jgi:nucleoside recognition membrane protein YjiH
VEGVVLRFDALEEGQFNSRRAKIVRPDFIQVLSIVFSACGCFTSDAHGVSYFPQL